MIAQTLIAGLFGLAVTASPPPPQMPRVSMIKSSGSIQCAPGISIGVTFGPEALELRLPDVFFGDTGHGRTDESMVCGMDIEFVQWWYKYRVAIKDVTYSGRLNLTNGVQLYHLGAFADFRYIHLENSHPIVQPEVRNLSTAVMIDSDIDPGIGGEGDFLDDFEVKSDSIADLAWSPCFDGGEGQGFDQTQIKFEITGTTRDPGDKGEGQFVDGGLTVRFGLAWEECTPNSGRKHAWGATRIDDWETCTYREADGNSTARAVPRDVGLRHGMHIRAGCHG